MPIAPGKRLSRRDFLKFSGINLVALAMSKPDPELLMLPEWPAWRSDQLPPLVQAIFQRMPDLEVAANGTLLVRDASGSISTSVPLATTQWNRENSLRADRLTGHIPWGIVLHWYGDRDTFDRSVKGYLRGFDSLREVDGELLRTSAHFLVGDAHLTSLGEQHDGPIGILQTQAPAKDGTPYVASHLRPLNYQAHRERKQYFVRAFYQLGYEEPGVYSLLQDMYDGPKVDPNMRTIAIEITGLHFDRQSGYPSLQKIANVVALVWALMKRYRIPVANLLGHHEIQLSKPDPGKKFINTIRYLVGVKALIERDARMKELVFGQFLEAGQAHEAVRKYFKFVRDYLVLVATPREIYEWESESQYWPVRDALEPALNRLTTAREFRPPLAWEAVSLGNHYLQPENHEGIDLIAQAAAHDYGQGQLSRVNLIANGLCTFVGDSERCQRGWSAIFRHRQPNGAEVLSVYSHLAEPGDLVAGKTYPSGYPVGGILRHARGQDPYLHFSVAYGATWEAGLHLGPDIPLNAGTNWIKQRYLEPLEFLKAQDCMSLPEYQPDANRI